MSLMKQTDLMKPKNHFSKVHSLVACTCSQTKIQLKELICLTILTCVDKPLLEKIALLVLPILEYLVNPK